MKELTFPIIIAEINVNKASFSNVDGESSYSSVILLIKISQVLSR
jgi:hypothetical protein